MKTYLHCFSILAVFSAFDIETNNWGATTNGVQVSSDSVEAGRKSQSISLLNW